MLGARSDGVNEPTGGQTGGPSVVRPSVGAIGRLRPLHAGEVRLDGGFWGDRQAINRARTIPHGFAQLEATGTLGNLRLAAGERGTYQALSDSSGAAFPFLDTDVYKWLEAVGWELGRGADPALEAAANETIAVVAAAQRPDGYLNSYVQVVAGGEPFKDLAWGHELYCIGHLIQAAVAWHRRLGDDRLLDIAQRAADAVDRAFGPAGRDGIDGHPEIEMALVELWRETGETRYLDLARRQLERARARPPRGRAVRIGVLAGSSAGPRGSDRRRPRRAPALPRRRGRGRRRRDRRPELCWRRSSRGGRTWWRPERISPAASAAAIATRRSATRTSCRPTVPMPRPARPSPASCSPGGCCWRPARRASRTRSSGRSSTACCPACRSTARASSTSTRSSAEVTARRRRTPTVPGPPWYPCACCPPNLMRLLASWEQYLATFDDDGVQIHQYATASVEATVAGGQVRLAIETGYPWTGRIAVRILATPDGPWALSLRIPPGAKAATLALPGADPRSVRGDVVRERRAWRAGDEVVLDLDLTATRDAVRPSGRCHPRLRRARTGAARLRDRDRRPARRRRARGRHARSTHPARAGRP